ncbi:hypothetical protein [Cellulomonas xiejunii]|uniref:HXXEE domain-containing protein n=1 Tax=Cellulomonas xiejunii TaxID=2968083 RepID=A0ABY5KMI6_9CELL|nr:hypothetical protein [Cellulomonas xiejunii]MCC2321124.1 hypothetical protein [Cellulomonas xiejunii]UUI71717.1 hypothetical protein NP048_18315 [Cellulomonas xiejunii]
MDLTIGRGRTLDRRDVAAAAGLCAVMCGVFWVFGSGDSLRVTFVPGAVVTFALIVVLHRTATPLPAPGRALPVYAVALGWQLLHFAEEFQTGFWHRFPALYGGAPYEPATFVWFNMASYVLFGAATAVAVGRGRGAVLMPSLFFVVYGTLGNAITHLVWAVMVGGYFPGLVTACGYLVIGPVLLRRMWPGATWWHVAAVTSVLALVLVPLLVAVAR